MSTCLQYKAATTTENNVLNLSNVLVYKLPDLALSTKEARPDALLSPFVVNSD
jgi:hypothetical protein